MNFILTAAVLGAFSMALVGPVSSRLARAQWVQRSPRAGVLLWQCVGLGAILSGIGAGLALAVSRYKAGFATGVVELIKGIFGGHPLQGLGLYDALGLTLAADLAIVLCAVFVATTVPALRRRARHRKLLDLLTYESPDFPGTQFLAVQRAVAYCLPGLRPRIVLSDGTRTLLGRDELWAVINHERGHAHEHHGLVMLPMVGLGPLFAWLPYARYAPTNISLLLEMAADDFSSRRSGRRPLAGALVEMSTTGWAPRCGLAAAGSGVAVRVTRLLSKEPTSKGSAGLAVALGIGAVVVPVCAAFLI